MASSAQPPSAHPELVPLAYRLVERLTAHYNLQLTQLGLSRSEAKVLLVLEADRPILVSTVAERLWADRSNTANQISRLTARGLIEKRAGEVAGVHDGRTRAVALTPLGLSTRESLMARTAAGNPVFADLGEQDLRTLEGLLRRIDRHAANPDPA
ncbi:MarR family winged helix-turn-helix transcriptional regulator [Streptomyces sp. MS06]|uniref:MarR family winged helix-turn-helix transcriptional regulator n=1 Tax=Streptomyces sp. MS06 TaxID=3385974 RepID=UPI00399F44FF